MLESIKIHSRQMDSIIPRNFMFLIQVRSSLTCVFFAIYLFTVGCNDSLNKGSENTYLNHNDSVKYVGKEQCRACHTAIYNAFIQTGMGRSFEAASRQKSAAKFYAQKPVYDASLNFYYYPFWDHDSMYMMEFRLQGKDTLYKRIERVDYIIGSGQHTNSHFTSINGYIYQLPLTWYTQQHQWDLPPGFEKGRNVRFSRAIGFECMSCHNAMPTLSKGSDNKFINVPQGIDCERCHGPGELHVKEMLAGHRIDTAIQIDRTIVNPRKLSWQRQIDLCQRCHLQGNAILKPGKHFNDFKPGMILSDVIEVYLPKYKGFDDEFIMASHAQRLQQSKCFIESNKNTEKKEGSAFQTLNLTCITCHNPHIGVKHTGTQIFNNACINCHAGLDACKEDKSKILAAGNNCVSCHMPRSGSVDIPHVTVHDHKIKIPITKGNIDSIRKFEGIYCVNKSLTDNESKAQAYLNYFEKFEGEPIALDSSFYYLNLLLHGVLGSEIKIHYAFLKSDFDEIIHISEYFDWEEKKDPWLFYRIGQAFQNKQQFKQAESAYRRAMKLDPNNLDFCNKAGVVLIEQQKFEEAIKLFEMNLTKQPKQEVAWVNLGFAFLNLKKIEKALKCYNKALELNPDFAQALLNRAGVYNLTGNKQMAIRDLKHILILDPDNEKVSQLIAELKVDKGR